MAVIEASLSDLRKRLKDVETAKGAGYNIPDALIQMLQGEINRKEGYNEVWECIPCAQTIKTVATVKQIFCRCGKIQRVWRASD